MHSVVAALTMCKFEATSQWHDQMVLCKILQTLDSCVECPSGRLLLDSDICAVFQAVYRIGFDTQVAAELSGPLSWGSENFCSAHFLEGVFELACLQLEPSKQSDSGTGKGRLGVGHLLHLLAHLPHWIQRRSLQPLLVLRALLFQNRAAEQCSGLSGRWYCDGLFSERSCQRITML
jgi:hypothetical protein